jgi:hypothetical protein
MKGGSLALVGLAVGVVGVLLAIAVRARWARPVGATLLVLAVLAEVAAVQARSPESGAGPTTPPVLQTLPNHPSTPGIPSSGRPFTVPPAAPQLLSQIHPGLLPITKAVVVNKEFIRLTNTGSQPAHIGGWVLSNGSYAYTFPVGLVVASGDSLVVRSGVGTNVPGTIHLNLTHYIWPKDAGTAILKNGAGNVVQTCRYKRDVAHDDPSASC